MTPFADIEKYRAAIATVRPDLADVPLVQHSGGWDSYAVEAAGWIFRFPRQPHVEERLRREAVVLELVAPRVTMNVPRLVLHEQPMLFTEHRMIPGDTIVTEQYERLNESQRQVMAEAIAEFFAQFHTIPVAEARAAGIHPRFEWPSPDELRQVLRERLPEAGLDFAERLFAAYRSLPQEREVFGFFDAHGWNMAFDHDAGVLNGIYDFADAATGPLSREFSYPYLISADLTDRIITAYEANTGTALDRRAVAIRMGMQTLGELAEVKEDVEAFTAAAMRWIDFQQSRPALAV